MDDERISDLLLEIGQANRPAFRDFFDEAGPVMAAQLAASGVPRHAAADAIFAVHVLIWNGDYTPPPLVAGQDQQLATWLGRFALDQAATQSRQAEQLLDLDEALWSRITKEAYPESPRNILRRLDVLFAVVAAVVWAVLLLVLTPR